MSTANGTNGFRYFDEAAECAVLGSLFHEKVFADLATDIVPEYFSEPWNFVFQAIADVASEGRPVIFSTVGKLLSERGHMAKLGGSHVLSHMITEGAEHIAIARENLRSIAEKFRFREAVRITDDLHKRTLAGEGYEPFDEAMQRMQKLREQAASKPVLPSIVDLGALVRAGLPRELPTVAESFDGQCLLYAGRLNEIHAEPSVGKTNVACAMVVAVVRAGGTALYLDPEDTPRGIAAKLVSFGLTDRELSDRVRYVHNPAPADYTAAQLYATQNPCTLVVCDGLAEALAAEGLNEDVPNDVLAFFRNRLRPFADSGAAVLVSDHVTKNAETRGRWARGSGAKLGRYDGAVYALALGEGYTRDKAGFVRLIVSKDRVGGIGVAGQTVAELHFKPDGVRTGLEWKRPDSTPFRPTALMAKVVAHLRTNPDAGLNELRKLGGKAAFIDAAIACLVEDKALRIDKGGNGKSNRYVLT